MPHALLLDWESGSTLEICGICEEEGFSIDVVESVAAARDALLRHMPEIVIVNLELDDGSPSESAVELFDNDIFANVVDLYLVTEQPDYQQAAWGMRLGASDYLVRSQDMGRLRENLQRFISEMNSEAAAAADAHKSGRGLLNGESPAMQRLYRTLRKVAPTDATILLAGESGTGKELTSRTIHDLSLRADGPFVAVNCGAISSELTESELFGHIKGAFTGALKEHRGFFERADKGTLFLDEVTEMSAENQVKLLRVLETRKFRRVGGEKDFDVDVRIIASTNRDPSEAVESGVLREDLYYRLAQFPIRIPALRERGDDIELLARRFLDELVAESGIEKDFDSEYLDVLRMHDWPGNVRELRNNISRAYILAGKTITTADLPGHIPLGVMADGDYLRVSVGQSLAETERRLIFATLDHYAGDKAKAAEVLGVSVKTLYNRLKKYQLINSS